MRCQVETKERKEGAQVLEGGSNCVGRAPDHVDLLPNAPSHPPASTSSDRGRPGCPRRRDRRRPAGDASYLGWQFEPGTGKASSGAIYGTLPTNSRLASRYPLPKHLPLITCHCSGKERTPYKENYTQNSVWINKNAPIPSHDELQSPNPLLKVV